MHRIVILSDPHRINYDLIRMLTIMFPDCAIEVAPASLMLPKDGVPAGKRDFGSRADRTPD